MNAEHDTRSIEKQVRIGASAEAVWKALTDAEELTRWFPLDARVKPGPRGSVWMSWRNGYAFETPIDAWEPNRHLRLAYRQPNSDGPAVAEAGSASERSDADVEATGRRIAMDFHIEAEGGTTVLRIVHSGFGPEADCDEQYDGTARGWEFQLAALRHYLEHHAGAPREAVAIRRFIPAGTRAQAWDRLMSEAGFPGRGGSVEALRAGDRYDWRGPGGDGMRGEVWTARRPLEFSGTVENLNQASLRVHMDELWGRRDVNVWINTYGLADGVAEGLRRELEQMVERVLPGCETA